MTAVEFCVDGADALAAADALGADTLELCSGLALGGLTPSLGLLEHAQSARTDVHVLIRPRPGGFCYSALEVSQMVRDVAQVREMGLAGVVIGAATEERHLDQTVLQHLIDAAEKLPVTLHRVIDTVTDPLAAVDTAIDLGIARILSSGGAALAVDGADVLAAMVRHARGRIRIVAGAGLNSGNVASLVRKTGVDGVHGSCSTYLPMPPNPDLFEDGTRSGFDPTEAQAFLAAARSAPRPSGVVDHEA